MACCGTSVPKPENGEQLLNKLRDFSNMEVTVNLNKIKMTFMPQKGKWKTNFGDLPNAEDEKKRKELEKLNEESKKKDKEIEEMERNYLAKIAKLLVMTQVHCETKTFINNEFDKLGVTKNYKTTEKIVPIDNEDIKDSAQVEVVENHKEEPILA